MDISGKIMLAAAILLGGFLWSYLFVRQICYNYIIAFPMIRKMNDLQPDLIAVGAKRYTTVSVIATGFLAALILALVIWFFRTPERLYLLISFAVGAIAALVMFLIRMKPDNKEMFDLFANAYYRFVPDDELRTALAKKEYKQIRPRLKEMGVRGTFIPKFK